MIIRRGASAAAPARSILGQAADLGPGFPVIREIVGHAGTLDGAAGRAWKVRREDQSPGAGVLLEKALPRSRGLDGVDAKPRAPSRIAKLQRVVHQVRADDGFAPAPA